MKHVRSFFLGAFSFMGSKLRHTPLVRWSFLTRTHAALSLWLHSSHEVDIGLFCVRFDPRDHVIAKKLILYGEYEKYEIALLCSLLKPGDQVLDIGANIGLYSLYLSRAVGPEGSVVSVEPDPENLALLRANIETNGCKNVIILPCAFGVKSGCIELFQVEHNRGNLSFADLAGTGRSVIVPMRRGEEALAELRLQPAVAKIHVEGAEPLVLSGLGRYKPNILLFQFAPQMLRALGHNPETFLDSLVAEGYTLELVDPHNGARTQSAPAEITAFMEPLHRNYNILAIRN
jgi:FkbM family methyltransferase